MVCLMSLSDRGLLLSETQRFITQRCLLTNTVDDVAVCPLIRL